MNLLFKRIFGGLKNTEKFEAREAQILEDYKRYCDIQTSEELKQYTALFNIVKSAQFQDKKKTLQNRKFKDTEEYRDFHKFEKLSSSWKIKSFYETKDSSELKDFLNFKNTEEYKKLGNEKEWKKDERLKNFKKFERSREYKNYEGLKNSYIIKEFEELKNKVNTEEFKKNKAWWEDKNRWQKTDEYKQEQDFYAMKKSENIKFYEETDPKQFEKVNEWQTTFEDKFEGTQLNGQWKNGYFHRAQTMKNIYSFANEKQANTDGKNISVNNSLSIITKQEATEGVVWDTKKGFIKQDKLFTSGNINTGEVFSQRYGKIQAKVKIERNASVSHTLGLTTDGMIPSISVFAYNGKNLSVGTVNNNGGKAVIDRETIKGINPENYYIYTMEWDPKEIVWKINNVVVKRTTNNIPDKAMHIAVGSFISEKNKGGESILKIEWIKVSKRK